MKTVILVPIACLVGILIGAWGPREEIREMKRLAEERPAKPKTIGAEGVNAITKLVNIPDAAKHVRRKPVTKKSLGSAATNATDVAASATNKVEHSAPLTREDLAARIDEARELWQTRVELARANWKSKLQITPADEPRFNAAMDDMNDQLYDAVNSFSKIVAEKGTVSAELGLRLVGEATTIMTEAYDKVAACVSADRRDDVADMMLTDFIDPGVAEPLISIQSVLTDADRLPRHRAD